MGLKIDENSEETELSVTGTLESALFTSEEKVDLLKTPTKPQTPITQISSVKETEDPDLKKTFSPIDIPPPDYSQVETKLFLQKTTDHPNKSQLLRTQKDLAREKLLRHQRASQELKEIGEKPSKTSSLSPSRDYNSFANYRFGPDTDPKLPTPQPSYYWDTALYQKMLHKILIKKFQCGIQESALKDFVLKRTRAPDLDRKIFCSQTFAIF